MASWLQLSDDIGLKVELERPPARVVSLVPSWTQTLFALGAGDMVVAATRFCVEPAEALAGIPRVGGTKNPNLREIVKLKPDLVIANAEENRREDIERSRLAESKPGWGSGASLGCACSVRFGKSRG
jgi:ABC-type Fe3+-hydroxamate transport system substrate-binding protein